MTGSVTVTRSEASSAYQISAVGQEGGCMPLGWTLEWNVTTRDLAMELLLGYVNRFCESLSD